MHASFWRLAPFAEFPIEYNAGQWNSSCLLFPEVIVMGLIKPFKYMPLCQFCVLFALSNTSVLLKVSLDLALWRWKRSTLNTDGFTHPLANNTKALMATTECRLLSRTAQRTTWIWLKHPDFFHQTKSTFSFTTWTARETHQIGRTLLAVGPTVRQCAKWPRTVLQLFKILKANLDKEAAAGCSCQQLAFHRARFVVLTSTLRSSGLKASQRRGSCRTVVPLQLRRRFGVLRFSRAIVLVPCLFLCLLRQFRDPCLCLTARRIYSPSHQHRQRI